MIRSTLRLTIVATPLLLSGCVAVWGSAYQVESKTPDAMLVHYDTHFIDDTEIEELAKNHCQTYGKTVLLQSHDKDMMNISTDNFLCQNPAPNPVAAPQ